MIKIKLEKILLLCSAISVLLLAGCAAGTGMRWGTQTKSIHHSGYSYDQIFDAAEQALDRLGIVTSADKSTGIIEGQIPPYRVKAICERGSSWLKLEGIEKEQGAWKQGAGEGEWSLSLIDGTLRYRQGAETLKEAVDTWSKAINRLIP